MSASEGALAVDSGALDDLRRRAAEPDQVRALLAERVGVARDADLTTITAALDTALASRPFAGPPEGSELVDSPTLAALRTEAEVGRNLRRDQLITNAINTGRIPPAARPSWQTLYDLDPASAEAMLHKLKPNTIPIEPLGRSGNPDDAADLGRELGFGW